ncbi:MAG: DUF86 domain-containing protein [Chloroflexi bacterium]|nr:DUF86 domain-containing protein [Chloroflexota bacterium]
MMSPADQDVIRRKLDRIIKCLQRIREAQRKTLDDYLSDQDLQFIMERQLELIIGAAVDANVHILAQSGFGTPADAYTSFFELARHTEAIPMDLASQMAPATGLRNRLAHDYEEIDHKLVHRGLGEALALFPKYIEAVEKYLSSLPAQESFLSQE